MLTIPRFSATGFGHSKMSVALDQPYCQKFQVRLLYIILTFDAGHACQVSGYMLLGRTVKFLLGMGTLDPTDITRQAAIRSCIECIRGGHRGRNFTSCLRFSGPFFHAAKWASSTPVRGTLWRTAWHIEKQLHKRAKTIFDAFFSGICPAGQKSIEASASPSSRSAMSQFETLMRMLSCCQDTLPHFVDTLLFRLQSSMPVLSSMLPTWILLETNHCTSFQCDLGLCQLKPGGSHYWCTTW